LPQAVFLMPSYKKHGFKKYGLPFKNLALLFAHPAIRNVHGRKTRPGVMFFLI